MKKIVLVALALAFASAPAFSATTKETVSNESKKWGSFWSREGERSGLKESTSSWGQFWHNMNPGHFFQAQKEAYNSRKTGQPMSGVTTK